MPTLLGLAGVPIPDRVEGVDASQWLRGSDAAPPEAVLLPVGGVGPDAMADWWAAGARGFGLGSELYKPGMAADEVGRRAAVAVRAVRVLG